MNEGDRREQTRAEKLVVRMGQQGEESGHAD